MNPPSGSVLVTGATGFVGGAVVTRLREVGRPVKAAVRSGAPKMGAGVELIAGADLTSEFDWLPILRDCDAVVHAGARVHAMQDPAKDPLAEFRRVNVEGTTRLARRAAEAGVRRFVYLSSIKVNGSLTKPGRPFSVLDPPNPDGPYGLSKAEAEAALQIIGSETEMETVIVRPPLVYGPGVKANFRAMMRLLHSGVPLPFGAVDNRRSYVNLDNLVDLVLTCVEHPAAAGRVFLASDCEDLSTTELLRRTGVALGRPARLVPVPPGLMKACARLVGRGDMADRLLGWLQVDLTRTTEVLDWRPPVGVDQGLAATAAHFLAAGE